MDLPIFGVSEPANTAIKVEIPHDPCLHMEPTNKIWVVGQGGRYVIGHMLDPDCCVLNKVRPYLVLLCKSSSHKTGFQ